jgi:hypothetical protein
MTYGNSYRLTTWSRGIASFCTTLRDFEIYDEQGALCVVASSKWTPVDSASKKLIRITDNGSGIPKEQLALAFASHATSKLEKVEDLVKLITENKDLLAQFKKDPAAVVKKLIKAELDQETLEKLVAAVKAQVDIDKLSGALGALGGLFGKK